MTEEDVKGETEESPATQEAAADESAEEVTPEAEADAEPDIAVDVKVEDAGVCKKKLSITIPPEEIQKKFDESYSELQKSVAVRGFRVGHAPRRLIERRYRDDVEPEVKATLLGEGIRVAIEKEDLQIIGEPDIDAEKIEMPADGPLVFEVGIEVRPQIDLPEYDGIELDVTKAETADDDVEKALERLLAVHGSYESIGDKKAAKENDNVFGDVLMKVGDEVIVDKQDVQVPVAPVAIERIRVDKLLEILKGAKAGDAKTGTFTVTDDCPREELRGKEAELTVTVKEVRRLHPAELNEEFLAKVGAKDADELKAALRRNLEGEAEQSYRQARENALYDYLLEKTPLELPEELLKKQSETTLTRQVLDLQYRGVPKEIIQQRIEELKSASDQRASMLMKISFILDEIAKKENIEVTDEEVDA
ncbi:MAG: trigger factor, partial [Phycisphaerae bacterium]|nr:trigger factor [Phycisphaerae bacterium]